jgi:hypothetical protein
VSRPRPIVSWTELQIVGCRTKSSDSRHFPLSVNSSHLSKSRIPVAREAHEQTTVYADSLPTRSVNLG